MTSRGQELLKELLRTSLNATVIQENVRPDWLNGLELDFWVPELNLGVEFQGEQHYLPVYGLQNMADQQERDRMKRRLCEARKVILLTFDASQLERPKLKHKLNYHLARVFPELTRKQRLNKLGGMMRAGGMGPKSFRQKKREYCQSLKDRYNSPMAYRKGSQARRDARSEYWAGTWFGDVIDARRRAKEKYTPNLTRPITGPSGYGMGMARAKLSRA